VNTYIPERGDAAWLDLQMRSGHEQSGRCPVLILSPRPYNERTGMALVCPLTTRVKGYPFEIPSNVAGRPGAILADQVSSIDWTARNPSRIDHVPANVVDRVAATIATLIGATVR
jgi:mRNA interferase MazF